MKKQILFLLIITYYFEGHAQKPPVDTAVLDKWPMLQTAGIILTDDGKYIIYKVQNIPTGNHTLYISSTDNKWKKEWIGAGEATISEDNTWVAFILKDSLYLSKLGTEDKISMPRIATYSFVERNNQTWLIYNSKDNINDLIFLDLATQEKEIIKNVETYTFSPDNTLLIWQMSNDSNSFSLKTIFIKNKASQQKELWFGESEATNITFNPQGTTLIYTTKANGLYSLHYTDLSTRQDKIICKTKDPTERLTFDEKGQKLLFIADKTIWYYSPTFAQAEQRISKGISDNLMLNFYGLLTFNKNGENILFTLVEKEAPKHDPNAIPITIWSDKDEYLSSSNSLRKTFAASYNINDRKVILLEKEDESSAAVNIQSPNKFVLIVKQPGTEWWWRKKQQAHVSLVSLKDGSRNLFETKLPYSSHCLYELSPGEKYIVYYDLPTRNYFSFEIETKITTNITQNIRIPWEQENYTSHPDPFFGKAARPVGIAGWLKDDKWVLIYSKYDIWKIDPTGRSKPINLTGGFGKSHQILFTISDWIANDTRPFSEELLLQGVNTITMEAGLYRKKVNTEGAPELILKGAYASGSRLFAIKAQHANIWVVCKSDPTNSPNLYTIQDTKTIIKLSNIQPEKAYNWYTTELVNWRLPNGENCKGILVKPENFDSTKKYPLIFEYYEGKSSGLNYYQTPSWEGAASLNIPYYAGRGYLIFLPDIHIKIGYPGASALQSIVSAAKILSKRSYIDTTKMGLIGHSYGGFETNYIVSHSHIFAAAAEGAGMSDLIGKYGWISREGLPDQYDHEVSQTRIGSTLWKRPDLYIENSPVFLADKVSTPLLILHNKLDNSVPWQQGAEWFLALRRLGRPVWLLQYEGEGHSLFSIGNKKDYTIRLAQFFDYYLKRSQNPLWMKD